MNSYDLACYTGTNLRACVHNLDNGSTVVTSGILVMNLGLIEHHGVFIDSGHNVSYIRQSNKWYHCDDKHITETNLLTLSNNVYLMFYAKEVDLGT